MSQLAALRKWVVIQAKLYLREPVGVFFTLPFAPLLLVLMSLVFGNEPVAMFNGRGPLDVTVPTFAAIIVGLVGMMALPIETASRRESGALRRFRATPLRPLIYIIGDVLVYFFMVLLGVALLFLVGIGVYHVQFEGRVLSLLAGVSLSALAFLALGYVLASLVPNAQVAAAVGNALYIPMTFLSGISVPLEVMPDAVRSVARFVPLTSVVTLLRGLWFGDSFGDHVFEVAMLGGILVVGTVVAAWIFRWE